ncbi:hypothetical protein Gotri_015907 [Gossypium trilobum]|uniref:Ribosomal protein L27 n=1 Tax=Gossypium trilobum TaxID=34281 RepID=A0A7J9E1N4_9ROSI|nr:hypothetical protein [Gossypium trilobum]
MATATMSFNLVGAFRGLSLASSSTSSFMKGEVGSIHKTAVVSFPRKSPFPLTIESAHKKGAGILLLGQFHPGKNVGLGKDHTIFSLIDGLVKFEKFGPDKKKISVYPRVLQPENPNSYRARKREYFRMRREQRKAKKEGILVQPELVLASAADATDDNPVC